jgi:hypothetical protein
MDTATAATLSITILVAVAGYVATYLNNLRLTRRSDRLDRVSEQLSEFYGPLLALSSASRRTFETFVRTAQPGGEALLASEEREELFRLWTRHVFMPLNTRMVDLVTNKAHLLEEDYIPQFLLQLCAHVASYQAILRRWEKGDFTERFAVVPFPGDVLENYAETTFASLKREQNNLLGVTR